MPGPLRLAICNELFAKIPFAQACRKIRKLGYTGLEIAPYTLAEDPAAIPHAIRQEIRQTLEDEGLAFVGLHWLLAAPAGLHVTTRHRAVRKRSWEHVRHLIDLCADLAGSNEENNGVMVFGSPKQRSAVDAADSNEAIRVFTHELAQTAPHAESRAVTILVEPLPANQSNVVNSLAEAVCIVRQIASPAIQTMFDTHNAVDEKEEHASLIRRYCSHIRHVHMNEVDGREPGMGNYEFQPILTALHQVNYSAWVSVEVFDFTRDPAAVAGRAREHLESAQPVAVSRTL